ncbi:MAG: OmpA family protein [Akkermansiaceae bacterium]
MSKKVTPPLDKGVTIITILLGLITLPLVVSKFYPSLPSAAVNDRIMVLSEKETLETNNLILREKVTHLSKKLERVQDRKDIFQAELSEAREKMEILKSQLHALKTTEFDIPVANDSEPTEASSSSESSPAPLHSENTESLKLPVTVELPILTTTASEEVISHQARISLLESERSDHLEKLNMADKENNKLSDELTQLKASIQTRPQTSDKKHINDLIYALRDENTTLRISLSKAKEKTLLSEKNLKDKHQNELSQIEKRLAQFKRTVSELRAKIAFASSADELSQTTISLFEKLQGLEGNLGGKLNQSYSAITQELKAMQMARVKFDTGSTILNAESLKKIEALSSDTKENDEFLIVGYASEVGNSEINENISSARAKAVTVKLLNALSDPHSVQAVYLGETTRFGERSENQCVEIWRIAK